MIDNDFKEAFSQLIQTQISNGKTRLDIRKIASYLTNLLGEEITVDSILSISEQFPFVPDPGSSAEGHRYPENDSKRSCG